VGRRGGGAGVRLATAYAEGFLLRSALKPVLVSAIMKKKKSRLKKQKLVTAYAEGFHVRSARKPVLASVIKKK
jgi:hypothetical protein